MKVRPRGKSLDFGNAPAGLSQRFARSVFETQDVYREAHAALLLFREAVRQERVTVDLIRELMAYLKKARIQPELRFRTARS